MIEKIENVQEKHDICTEILHGLPDWFGVEESIIEYAEGVKTKPMWAAKIDDKVQGFVALRETSPYTAEVYVMGVSGECHRSGIGRKLFEALYAYAKEQGYDLFNPDDPFYSKICLCVTCVASHSPAA